MCVNSVFHQLNNSISSDLSTIFDSFNLALSYSLDILHPPLLLSTELILSFPGLILNLLTRGNYIVDYNVNMHPLNLTLILFPLKFSIALQEKTSLYRYTKSSYFTDMIGSYAISSKQAYKLSFTFVGKTQTNHLPYQPDLVMCSLFANFFKQKVSSIINVLPNINSAQLNLNLISTHNHCSCVSLPTPDIALSLMTSLKTNSPLILFHSIYFVHYHHILLDLSRKSFIYLLYHLLFHAQ